MMKKDDNGEPVDPAQITLLVAAIDFAVVVEKRYQATASSALATQHVDQSTLNPLISSHS